ncbi:site-specific integrase [Clostridia bacterium OttesenSCG-928-O13]|nr:site-specific integrase [Clostridia bacterium OttesenSCG-928-O13]
MCGRKQIAEKKRTKRANGEGSVYKLAGETTYTAQKVLGYKTGKNGKVQPVYVRKKGFVKKSDAYQYLPQLVKAPIKINMRIALKGLFDLWLPEYQRRGRAKSTENCYKAAMNYYRDIWFIPFVDIGIDDLQECVDDCPKGKQTRKNMKTFAGLLYDYAIPRGYVDKNLGRFLFPGGEPGMPREVFSDAEIEIIRKSIGKVPFAEFIYCDIYLGFRPHEFLTLDAAKYDREERCFIGGEKTEAGTNRAVTVSPKIQLYIDALLADKIGGPVFCWPDGKQINDKDYREQCFYPALEAMGIDNPRIRENGPHRLTPHCCRHTFATLMKRVKAPDKDKLELIGHTSEEMLRHYQHTNFSDLRAITDSI